MADTTGHRVGWRPSQRDDWEQPHLSVEEPKLGGGSVRPVMALNRTISSRPRQPYTYRHSGSSSFVTDVSHDDGQLPAHITSQPRLAIPKSRTFSLLSSLTQSFSRGSLTSQAPSSRIVSGESHASSIAAHDKVITHQPLSRTLVSRNNPASPTTATPSSPTTSPPDNPKEVATAMPPQYWAGRFMALQDRFHNEMLEPHQLSRICQAQGALSFLPDLTSSRASAAAAQNNPSISAYALTRVARTASSKYKPAQNGGTRLPSRIPQSATSGAILQSTPYGYPRSSSFNQSITIPSTVLPFTMMAPDENSIPEHPTAVMMGTGIGTTTLPSLNNNTTTYPLLHAAAANDDDDDDIRTRRVFLHLEQLCVTDVARMSLKA
ncbi:hypothetical protein C8A00DRAFT_41788 [Chaetomidium leptoderma]|uniref:Uncharacterized protein n=1 Tax=Chaetomidium leptoderma TaxID=669021 RepID=A0AAN6ZXG9_9PEZI|nr:hypothetical protein C8A00DRAFT_41788 [Chaetomidium leptoderma]